MVSCERFPYGVMALTLVYLVFVLLVAFLSPVECLEEPCNSEGLDNSILGWSTDFFIGISMILCGIQLWWFVRKPVYFSAAVALVCMGIAYILGGIGHSVYTNSGFDDNAGQQGFYITWTISFTFMTLSVEETYRFTRQVMKQYTIIFRRSECLSFLLQLSFFLVLAAWIATMTGYIWCAAEEDLHVDGKTDSIPGFDEEGGADPSSLESCLRLASVSEITWYTTFSVFWIPVGIILRRIILASNEQPRLVYGLSNAWAALWVTIIPWTFGVMLIVWSGVMSLILGLEATQVYETIYGAVVHHFGMLVGYFLFHNIAYSLPRDEQVLPSSSTSNKVHFDTESTMDKDFAQSY